MTQDDYVVMKKSSREKLIRELKECKKENQQLKKQKDDVLREINFYETTEWGLRGYEILEKFRRMLGEI